jgi:hypothetical protein
VAGYLTKEVYENPKSGEKLTAFDKDLLDLNKPDNYELKVKMAMLYKLLKKDPTLSTIQKNAVSKESSSLFKKVQHVTSKTDNKENKKETKPTSWF